MTELCSNIPGEDLDYKVWYDFHPREAPNYNVESPTCGPGWPAHVQINRIEVRPHGCSHWFTPPIEAWNRTGAVWALLYDECMNDTENVEA